MAMVQRDQAPEIVREPNQREPSHSAMPMCMVENESGSKHSQPIEFQLDASEQQEPQSDPGSQNEQSFNDIQKSRIFTCPNEGCQNATFTRKNDWT